MGQKVRPTAFRVGVTENWQSRWYADKRKFSDYILEDFEIRKFIKGNEELRKAGIPKIEIERPGIREVTVILHASRPGAVIGTRGAKIDQLKAELETLLNKKRLKDESVTVSVQIEEVEKAELNAQLVAESIAEQLERRQGFRRLMKNGIKAAIEAGALGCKMVIGGRIGGAEIARVEKDGKGSIPLQTLRANISYGFAEAKTTAGRIGIKVWIHLGEYPEVQHETKE